MSGTFGQVIYGGIDMQACNGMYKRCSAGNDTGYRLKYESGELSVASAPSCPRDIVKNIGRGKNPGSEGLPSTRMEAKPAQLDFDSEQ